jgi:hypothetical protein
LDPFKITELQVWCIALLKCSSVLIGSSRLILAVNIKHQAWMIDGQPISQLKLLISQLKLLISQCLRVSGHHDLSTKICFQNSWFMCVLLIGPIILVMEVHHTASVNIVRHPGVSAIAHGIAANGQPNTFLVRGCFSHYLNLKRSIEIDFFAVGCNELHLG